MIQTSLSISQLENMLRFGDRDFSVAGSRIWNNLPPELRHADISFLYVLVSHGTTRLFGYCALEAPYLLTYLQGLKTSSAVFLLSLRVCIGSDARTANVGLVGLDPFVSWVGFGML